MKPKLSNVTLVCVDCVNYGEAISAIRKSMYQADFAKSIFLTDIEAYNPKFPFEIVKIPKISSKQEYSRFMIKELHKYITTDFVMVVQHDGWILSGEAWDDDFINYDYIGSPWLEPGDESVGNGGVSIRSRRLQEILATDDYISITDPEDNCICKYYRKYLQQKYDIKFAPEALAEKFGFELREPICNTFAFHGKFHEPFKPTVVIKRDAAGGDIVMVEPVLEYFHNKGNKVVLDSPIHLALIYAKHHYPVFHISQLTDNRIKPIVIDLNMAYEKKPKQNHLKSYYEAAGISDGELKSPKLNFPIGDHNRVFNKYVVIHSDLREQPHRNIYGIEWGEIASLFKEAGYDVIQVGLTGHEEIEGAIWMNTPTTNMLLYLIAGASFFIGIDSLPSHIAVATSVPAIIFSGSVDLRLIHPDLSNILWIHNHDKKVCSLPFCWHESESVVGQDCIVDVKSPPCAKFDTAEAVEKINSFIQIKINGTL